MKFERLTLASQINTTAILPAYNPAKFSSGIVHIGPGAFHRAHQAVYTDAAIAADPGDWRITGISLHSAQAADALNPQNGLYTLLQRHPDKTTAQVIGSIEHIVDHRMDPMSSLDTLLLKSIKIVSLTVTEKAYGLDRLNNRIDANNASVAHDLQHPRYPTSPVGLLVEALRQRQIRSLQAFTILCCDNLPANGELLRSAVLDYADRLDPNLCQWISSNASFPSSMVDRITPASTETTLSDAQQMIGFRDQAAIETEPFCQWIIEDNFCQSRPKWEAGGALFVDTVAPYEKMKLRMLNGTHSLIAYVGHVAGYACVRDVMGDPTWIALVKRHMHAAAKTLEPLAGIDFKQYANKLLLRFTNPAIAHQTYQIAMDGTEKLPQRLLQPAVHALHANQDIRSYAFATAAWMRYCTGKTEHGTSYALRDPQQQLIGEIISAHMHEPHTIVQSLQKLPGVFPEELVESTHWNTEINSCLSAILEFGMAGAAALELNL